MLCKIDPVKIFFMEFVNNTTDKILLKVNSLQVAHFPLTCPCISRKNTFQARGKRFGFISQQGLQRTCILGQIILFA
jgi:hypothetical protein